MRFGPAPDVAGAGPGRDLTQMPTSVFNDLAAKESIWRDLTQLGEHGLNRFKLFLQRHGHGGTELEPSRPTRRGVIDQREQP
jgi:hypothetical protein